MSGDYVLFSAQGSGGVAVEAALTLIGAPFELVEAPTFEASQRAAGDHVLAATCWRPIRYARFRPCRPPTEGS